MPIVVNKLNCVYGLGSINLVPGQNDVSDADLKALKASKHVQADIKKGVLELGKSEAHHDTVEGEVTFKKEGEYTDDELLAMSDEEAKGLSSGIKGKRTRLINERKEGGGDD